MSILYAEHRCLVLGIFYFHPFPFAGTHRILLSPIPLRQRHTPHTPHSYTLTLSEHTAHSHLYALTPSEYTAHSHLYALTPSERAAHSHPYAPTRAPTRIRCIYYPHSTLGCRTVSPQRGHPKRRKQHTSPPSPPRADQPQSTDSC